MAVEYPPRILRSGNRLSGYAHSFRDPDPGSVAAMYRSCPRERAIAMTRLPLPDPRPQMLTVFLRHFAARTDGRSKGITNRSCNDEKPGGAL